MDNKHVPLNHYLVGTQTYWNDPSTGKPYIYFVRESFAPDEEAAIKDYQSVIRTRHHPIAVLKKFPPVKQKKLKREGKHGNPDTNPDTVGTKVQPAGL